MHDRRLLLLPLLALLVAGLLWILQSSPAGPAGPDELRPVDREEGGGALAAGTAEPREAAAVALPAVREAVAGAADAEPAAYRRALGGLIGRLVWRDSGEPIPNVEVRAVEIWLDTIVPSLEDLLGRRPLPEPLAFRGEGRTDRDGRFEIRGVHSRALLVLAIGLRTETAAIRFVDRTPDPGETVDLGDIGLAERGTVTGRVVDAAGNPVEGARVRVADIPRMILQFGVGQFDPAGMLFVAQAPMHAVLPMPRWVERYDKDLPFGEARTDAEGRFAVAGVRPGQSTVIVTKPGKEAATRTLRVRSHKESQLAVIELRDGATLAGRFVGGDGQPVAGVRVSAGGKMSFGSLGFLGRPVEVDSGGSFRLRGLPRAQLYLGWQRAEGEPWQLSGPHRPGDTVVTELPSLRAGTITVQDLQGGPVTDAQISLLAADEAASIHLFARPVDTRKHVVADDAVPGRWRVVGLEAGRYRVVARADEHAIGTAILDLRPASASTNALLRLAAAPEQRFEVLDRAGRPVAAARIYWRLPGEGRPLSELPVLLGRTGADGVLAAGNVEEGASSFLCRHPAYALAGSGEQKTHRGVPIRFVLIRGGDVEGRLTEHGAPPQKPRALMADPRLRVNHRFKGVLMPRFTYSRPDGSFQFRNLDPGTWTIQGMPELGKAASIQDFIRLADEDQGFHATATVHVVAGQTVQVQLEITGRRGAAGTGSIVGSVRLGGRPATGTRVSTWAGGHRVRATVDASGSFALEGLPDGRHWVSVERRDREGLLRNQLWNGQVEVAKGGRKTLFLDLQAATVRVRVTDPDGNPASGLMLDLRGKVAPQGQAAGTVRVQAVTEADGTATFDDVPEAVYSLQAGGGRNARWVLPPTRIEAWASSSSRLHEVRAVAPVAVKGFVEWKVDDLDAEEQAFALRRKPSFLMLEMPGRTAWGRIVESGGRRTFTATGLAPGRYEVKTWGAFQWRAKPIDVPAAGLDDLTIVLEPDRKQVRAQLAAAKKKGKSKKKN